MIKYHLAWSPRRRKPVLVDDIGLRLDGLLWTKCRQMNVKLLDVNREPDMIHIHVEAPPELSPHVIVSRLKKFTASALTSKFFELRKMPSMWTKNYYASSSPEITHEELREFIDSQSKRA